MIDDSLTVVYDLDGTLVDTAGDLLAALNRSVSKDGLRAIKRHEIDGLLGFGGSVLISRAYKLCERDLPKSLLDQLYIDFLEEYEKEISVFSRPYPGVTQILTKFAGAGVKQGVCTNKPEGLARKLLGRLDLSQFFPVISGGDSFAYRKPDARHIAGVVADLGGDVDMAVMIGDSEVDFEAANNSKVKVLLMDYGYSHGDLRALSDAIVLSDFGDIPQAIEAIIA